MNACHDATVKPDIGVDADRAALVSLDMAWLLDSLEQQMQSCDVVIDASDNGALSRIEENVESQSEPEIPMTC